jgi:phosphonate dehydrogenase
MHAASFKFSLGYRSGELIGYREAVVVEKPSVVVTHWVHDDVLEHLRQFCTPVAVASRTVLAREEVLARAGEAVGLLACMTDHVDQEFLERCPRLRVISATLKGYDNFDVAACTRRGVWLTALPDQLTTPAAELCIGLMVALMRHVLPGDRRVRTGRYHGWRPDLYGSGLAGATVGIIGMGMIGQAVAQRLRAFDTTVLYTDVQALPVERSTALGVRGVPLDELLAASDVVLPLLPLRPSTVGMIGEEALAQMRPGAYLVNISRGSLVDEAAVAEALESGRLAGYAADVFRMEDWASADRPDRIPAALLAHPRTVFTPHLGSAVDEVRRAMSHAAVDQIAQVLAGHRPSYAVNELPC